MKWNPKLRRYLLHGGLFIITLICTTLAGAEWMFGNSFLYSPQPLGWQHFLKGFTFSLPFLGILTVHELGHYITARRYGLRASLPYYLPMWLGFLGLPTSIGTLGAFIRIRSRIRTTQQYFDVGIAGPLAGFVVAIGVLWYGFANLPPIEYIFTIHPEYRQFGVRFYEQAYKNLPPGSNIIIGTNLVFEFFKTFVADPQRIPPPQEMMHYPWLMAGYLALFFTALNLLPIGQLDGGHILYGLIGSKWHRPVALTLFWVFIFYAGLGLITPDDPPENLAVYLPIYLIYLYWVFGKTNPDRMTVLLLAMSVFGAQFVTSFFFPRITGYQGWLVFGWLLGRILGIYHPPAMYEAPLSKGRQLLGWIALLIFVLCFSPRPFVIK
ncbi:MAG: site-2 protease family protein [Cytophagales bacterium]|nr:site-2 protease family protein [Bernardetiaceae bacterium]MDW8210391.1 site-2 protease family protein [Cytophagales bacterium]